MIVVFDAGVWISALEFRGVPSQAMNLAAIYEQIVICKGIEEEVVRIMQDKFLRKPSDTLRRIEELLGDPIRVLTVGTVSGVCRDPNDDFVLECAVLGQADIIVTGDKDLLSLGGYEGVRIITPRGYLDESMQRKQ